MSTNLLQQLNNDMSTTVSKVRRSLVQINNGRGGAAGAGTIWHEAGLIITNAHVAQRDMLKVSLSDECTLPARLLAYDVERDLAALSVEANDLPTITLGHSRQLQPGQWVLALGHPWGVPGAVTAGVVINTGPPPEIPTRGELIQVGLHLRPGHSGGPLVDIHGRLVGINTMIAGPDVGLAIPVHVVKAFLHETLGATTDNHRS
jgi:S1-C subfamily serine protease